MNLVGAGGKGESVWVAWFQVARADAVRGHRRAARRRRSWPGVMRSQADQLRAAVEEHAWDGGWYLRACFDDGTPLGSHVNDECQIDSLPQSWARAMLPGLAADEDRRA